MSSKNVKHDNENLYFNIIAIILTIILLLVIPSILKLNRCSYFFGFIISNLIIYFMILFLNTYYIENSWYTEQYHLNNTYIYKEAFKDIFIDTKKNIKYGVNNIFDYIKNGFSYIFRPIKSIFFR